LAVDPGIPGPNRFRLRLSDFDTGTPVRAQEVELRFEPAGIGGFEPSTLPLRPAGDGVYQGVGANLAAGGSWEVTALVQRGEGAVEIPLRVATLCETTEIPGPENLFTIDVVELPDGSSVQAYTLDLGGGRYEVHFTFLDSQGKEVDVEGDPTLVATGPAAGDSPTLSARPLSRGHFYGVARLDPGTWRFDGAARGSEGQLLTGCLEETLGP
jgi:nitrogen fixation protein FixH